MWRQNGKSYHSSISNSRNVTFNFANVADFIKKTFLNKKHLKTHKKLYFRGSLSVNKLKILNKYIVYIIKINI